MKKVSEFVDESKRKEILALRSKTIKELDGLFADVIGYSYSSDKKIINAVEELRKDEEKILNSIVSVLAFMGIPSDERKKVLDATLYYRAEMGLKNTQAFLSDARWVANAIGSKNTLDEVDNAKVRTFTNQLEAFMQEFKAQAGVHEETQKDYDRVATALELFKNTLKEAQEPEVVVVPNLKKKKNNKAIMAAFAAVLISAGTLIGGIHIGKRVNKQAIKEKDRVISGLEGRVTDSEAALAAMTSNYADLSGENSKLKADNAGLVKASDELLGKFNELSAQLQDSLKAKQKVEDELQTLQTKYNALVSAGESAEKIAELTDKIAKLEKEKATLSSLVDDLRNQQGDSAYADFYYDTQRQLSRYGVSSVSALISVLEGNVSSAESRAQVAEQRAHEAEDRLRQVESRVSVANAERDRAVAERDAARAERDRAIAERDAARAERDEYKNKYAEAVDQLRDYINAQSGEKVTGDGVTPQGGEHVGDGQDTPTAHNVGDKTEGGNAGSISVGDATAPGVEK